MSEQRDARGSGAMSRIGIIGYGAVADALLTALESAGALHMVAAILVRRPPPADVAIRYPLAERFVTTLGDLLRRGPQVVVEAGGHDAVSLHGPGVLAAGADLLLSSVGALANPGLAEELQAAAAGKASVLIPSGAVAGLDGLLAARTAGLREVTYTSLKPFSAWAHTPAERLLQDAPDPENMIFFDGTAREAATCYPKNANVAAAVGLAGIGLDRTRVRLGTTHGLEGPHALIEAEGDFGRFRFDILALATATNPKTSALTGHSLAAALRAGISFRLDWNDV